MSASKFIHNLYTTVNNPRWSGVIAWHAEGGFVIKDPKLFEKSLMVSCDLAGTMAYFKSQLTRHQFDSVAGFEMRYKQRGNLFAEGRTDLLAQLVELGRIKRTRVPKRARRPYSRGSDDDEEDAGDDYVPNACGCSHDCTLTRYEMSAAKKKIVAQDETIALLRQQLIETEAELAKARASIHETAVRLGPLAESIHMFVTATGEQQPAQTLAPESEPDHVLLYNEIPLDKPAVCADPTSTDPPAAVVAPVDETGIPSVPVMPAKESAPASPPTRSLPTLPPPSVLVLPPTFGPLMAAMHTEPLFAQEQPPMSTAAGLPAFENIAAYVDMPPLAPILRRSCSP